jgi:hypothetical protein
MSNKYITFGVLSNIFKWMLRKTQILGYGWDNLSQGHHNALSSFMDDMLLFNIASYTSFNTISLASKSQSCACLLQCILQ